MLQSFINQPLKLALGIGVFAALVLAAFGTMNGGKNAPDDANVDTWLKSRLARPPMPGPRPEQAEVLLLWRPKIDAAKVKDVVPLVDHPEGVDGVYGMDVAEGDALVAKLHAAQLMQHQTVMGAWLVALDRFGHQLGATPVLTPDNVKLAFRMAKGEHVRFPGMDDPFLDKPAPAFDTATLDGKPVSFPEAVKGKKTILTFYCGCVNCLAQAKLLAALQHNPAFKGVDWYAVTHMNQKQSDDFIHRSRQKYLGLDARGQEVPKLYNSETCPRVWYVDPAGTVRFYSYLGEDPKSVTESLERAVRG